ncbi:MAG: aryl-sulfate sulfotransferase [Chloroflexi bacterium]|nr:aryl-sulfate sulfotransferase [Chloroflexota bacterium]
MGWSKNNPNGLIHYTPQLAYRGYTLVTNLNGQESRLIDMEGHICHTWHSSQGIGYSYLLPNGNLLLRTGPAAEETSFLERPEMELLPRGGRTVAGAILELDWDSNVVWEYRYPLLHHDFERLPNGNTLVLTWELIPEEISQRVKGGHDDDESGGMLGDVVREITPAGDVVYEWTSWDHLDFDEDRICFLEGREEWTHQNALNVTHDGDLLVSFRQTDTIGIVDKASGEFTWKWGRGNISHQHHPTMLANGNVLLFDNGPHKRGVTHSRVIEVNPSTNEVAWQYRGDPPISFYSYHISGAERLPNGNTLICEGAPGRIFEVTPVGEIAWEYINPFLGQSGFGVGGSVSGLANSVFRAHRYGNDHPALAGKDLDPDRFANLNRLYA